MQALPATGLRRCPQSGIRLLCCPGGEHRQQGAHLRAHAAPSADLLLSHRSKKDRPLSKAISGPLIFLDLPLALKYNPGLLRGFTFFISTFNINISLYSIYYALQRSSLSNILFHSLINLSKTQRGSNLVPSSRPEWVRELGLLTTKHPLLCTSCFTHMSSPHAC